MEQLIVNLIAGALGGAGAGKASPKFDLGTIGNLIAGAVGGGVLGQIVPLLIPAVAAAAQSGNLTVGGVVTQLISGGAGGAILTIIIGAIKNTGAWRLRLAVPGPAPGPFARGPRPRVGEPVAVYDIRGCGCRDGEARRRRVQIHSSIGLIQGREARSSSVRSS